MNHLRARFGFALVVVLAAAAGCTRTGDGCSTGSDGCACVDDSGCDSGLGCTDGVCRDPQAGSAAGTPGAGNLMGAAGPITPLPARTFVFNRRTRTGGSMDAGDGRFYPTYKTQLYVYDLATRKERRIHEFGLGDFALSPDRRWLAFVTSSGSGTPWDNPGQFKADVLAARSVDGKQVKRLSPRLPDDFDEGPGCLRDSHCPLDSDCQSQVCVKVNLKLSYSHPVWSRDGQSIYFEEYSRTSCNPYIVELGDLYAFQLCMYSIVRGVSGGAFIRLPHDRYCFQAAPLAVHPQLDRLLVNHERCRGPTALREFALPFTNDSAGVRTLSLSNASLFDRRDAAWLPDGSALLLVAGHTKKTVVNPEGFVRDYRMGVHTWSEGTGFQTLYESATDDEDVVSLEVSSGGEAVVEVKHTIGTQEISQLHLFDVKTGKIGEQLTTEESLDPRW